MIVGLMFLDNDSCCGVIFVFVSTFVGEELIVDFLFFGFLKKDVLFKKMYKC